MGIETSKKKAKGKFCQLPKEERNNNSLGPTSNLDRNLKANRNAKGKKSARRQPNKKAASPVAVVASPVQRLYDICKEVFPFGGTGIIPSPDKIEKLKTFLDGFKAADLNVNPEMPHFRRYTNVKSLTIKYLHLYECDQFSIGVFCFPPSGVIPLHNHPGMTVFSKLLFGTMHTKSYDWVDDVSCNTLDSPNKPNVKHTEIAQTMLKSTQIEVPGVHLAKVKVDSDFTAPCETCILYPVDGGNMHKFTAVTACAILDVLGPPYSDPDGRHCTYFYDFPYAKFSVGGMLVPEEDRESYAWLQERENPDDLVVLGELYKGAAIVER